jgi:hypothetical protein
VTESLKLKRKIQVLPNLLFFSIVSLIVFFLAFDTLSYLNPYEISWFGIDNTTAYIAQLSYVSSDWKFPLLRNPEYGGPLSTSLTFTGPAPIIGLTMKLLNLDAEIQLFGIWILLNIFLQLVFANRLLRLMGITANFARVFSAFFLSTFLIIKIQSHFWLISHYLILWSLYLLLFYISRGTYKALEAGILLCLSYLTNIYLLAMVILVILLIFIIRILSLVESAKHILADFSRLFGLLFVVFLTLDGIVLQDNFYQTAKTFVSSTYGYHGFNLLTFFNPDTGYLAEGASSSDPEVIKYFSLFPFTFGMIPGAYEGFMYLGFGVILGLLFLVFMQYEKSLISGLNLNVKQKSAIVFFAGFVTIFSISYRIGIGSVEIELPFPRTLDHVFGIFRSSGRFMWPFAYFLISLSVLGFYLWYSSRTRSVLTFVLTTGIFVLQVVDIAVPLINQERRVLYTTNQNNFEVPEFKEALKIFGGFREIRAYPQGDFLENHYAELNYLAWKLGIPTDLHFTSRVNMSAMLEREKKTILHLCEGKLEASTIYAVTNTSLQEISVCDNAPKPVLVGEYHTYFVAPMPPAD